MNIHDLRITFHMSGFNGYLVTAITYKIKEDLRLINKTILYILQKYYFNVILYFQNGIAMYLHPDLNGKLARPQYYCD
jgi:uncharacterized membrane protein